jgi:hypothetical protein
MWIRIVKKGVEWIIKIDKLPSYEYVVHVSTIVDARLSGTLLLVLL